MIDLSIYFNTIMTIITPIAGQGGHQREKGEEPGEGHHSGNAVAGVDPLVPVRIGNHHEPVTDDLLSVSFK